jgi:DNA repair protein RadC
MEASCQYASLGAVGTAGDHGFIAERACLDDDQAVAATCSALQEALVVEMPADEAENGFSWPSARLDDCSSSELLAIILGAGRSGVHPWPRIAAVGCGVASSFSDTSGPQPLAALGESVRRGGMVADCDADASWRLAVESGSLAAWSRAEPARLVHAWRLAPDLALRVAACFALGRLVESERAPSRARLQSPALVQQLMVPRLRGLPVETLHVLLLDGKHRLQRIVRVSEGTLTNAMVHPREVYAPALEERAAAVIAVHNHPSGDPEPSDDDLRVTRRLIETGVLLGVPLVDHVIVAEGGYVSLRERLRWEA